MKNRFQLALGLLVGVLVTVNLLTLALMVFSPEARGRQLPVLLTIFVVTLLISLPSIVLLPRWLMMPFRRLVDAAEQAPVVPSLKQRPDETEFVLQTFQEVVRQLQAQQAELQLLHKEARERAASAESFNERIVASLPSGLIAFDHQGRATVINASAHALLEADHVDDQPPHVRLLLRNAPELIVMVEECIKSGKVFLRTQVTTLNSDHSHHTRRLGATVAPIGFASGGELYQAQSGAPQRGALCLITDLTEVTELREQVALKRNLESLGEMAAGLAHEFKNSLATLHGYAQLLQQLDDNERQQPATSALLDEVRYLSEMVTSFLNFARPQPLTIDIVSLRELVDECANELQPLYAERGISLLVDGEFPEVPGDARLLQRALSNLLRNAAEAFDTEHIPRQVKVRGSREMGQWNKDMVVIEISDTGSGIPPANLPHIFVPFFTTKSKGHGVGLALAHRVVTEHGGTLSATNNAEGGAVFTIKLPT